MISPFFIVTQTIVNYKKIFHIPMSILQGEYFFMYKKSDSAFFIKAI